MGDLGLRREQTWKIGAENKARIEMVESKLEKQEARGYRFENKLKKTRDQLADLIKIVNAVKQDAMKMGLKEEKKYRESNRNILILHCLP